MLTIALIEAGKASEAKHPSGWDDAVKLYCDEQTKARIAAVKARKIPWYFLNDSGMAKAETPIRPKLEAEYPKEPYDIADWHIGVANMLMLELWSRFDGPVFSEVTIELHASLVCRSPLKEILELFGLKVLVIKEVPA
jgi:hypothetical protein